MILQRLSRLADPALAVGGLLWIAIHLIVTVVGLQTGKLAWNIPTAHQPLLARIYYPFLYLSFVILCVGLLGGCAWLEGRSRKLGITVVVLASIGIVTSILNLLLISITYRNSLLEALASVSNTISGLSTLLATMFLGWAMLRTRVLPRRLAWTLIVIGIVTLPILLISPLPIGPNWATDTLAFFLSGIGYAVVGLNMLPGRKHTDRDTGDISINSASQVKNMVR